MDKFLLLKRIRTTVLSFFITILIFVVILDPNNNIFYIKDFTFVFILILWLITLFYYTFEIPGKIIIILFFIAVIMPLYSVIVGYFNGNEISLQAPYLKSFLFFLLLPVLINLNINITKRFNRIGFIIPSIVLFLFIISYLLNDYVSTPYNFLVFEKQVAVSREYYVFGFRLFNLFYKTSPLLLFPLCFYFQNFFFSSANLLNKKRYFFAILLLSVAFLLSSTRANVIIFIFFFLGYSLFYLYLKNKKAFFLISGILTIVFFMFFFQRLLLTFNTNETSNNIKSQHINDYIKLYKTSPSVLWLGQGINSCFYSTHYNNCIKTSELSYFELLRIWGIPMSLLFIFFLIYPIIHFFKNYSQYFAYRYIPIAYLAYLLIAGTNPLLLSSTGMIVIVYVYSILVIQSNDFKIAKIRKAYE